MVSIIFVQLVLQHPRMINDVLDGILHPRFLGVGQHLLSQVAVQLRLNARLHLVPVYHPVGDEEHLDQRLA